jgi:hypothetical protein
MGKPKSTIAGQVSTAVVLALFAAAAVTTVVLYWAGDWERHAWGLTLTWRIVWGCWVVIFLVTLLTRVTIFGWTFRRYFPWPAEAPAPPPTGGVVPRPTRAPWPKSGIESFSITVVMVSLTGAAAIAIAVMWILKDVTGAWVFSLIWKVIGSVWWVLIVSTVVTRVAIFGWHRQQALQHETPAGPGPHKPAAEEKS